MALAAAAVALLALLLCVVLMVRVRRLRADQKLVLGDGKADLVAHAAGLARVVDDMQDTLDGRDRPYGRQARRRREPPRRHREQDGSPPLRRLQRDEREEAQGKRLATLAREAGVEHYVYTSVGSAHKRTGIPHFDNKWRIEETVRGLHFPSHVILRPVFFMENLLAPFSLQGSTLAWALGPGTKLQMIAVDDIGWFGARAFTAAAALNRREIDLAGDVRTMPEAAEILTEALGQPIAFAQTPIEQVRQYSKEMALMLQWFERVGYSADIAGLEREFGRALTKLPDWARRHARPTGR